jgi:hypothetical protein
MRRLFILLLLTITYSANAQVDIRPDSAIVKSKLRIKNHNEGVGKVLTSDALGNASWQSPSGGGGLWTQTLGFIENTNSNGFWSRFASALPIGADNTSYPPASPTSGNGTRMAWIPSRSAFQGGTFNTSDGSVRFVSENIGLFSFCYGLNSESRSRGGIAMGEGAIADGISNTLAFGESVVVRGTRNFGLGLLSNIEDGTSNTILLGQNSNALAGQYNYGMGWGLQMSGYGTSTFGSYNVIPTGSNTTWVNTDPLFVIGNGSSNVLRSNALMVLKDGRFGINRTQTDISSISQKLQVSGGAYIEGGLRLPTGAISGRYLRTDASGNATWAALPSFSLSLPYNDGISNSATAFSITNTDATGFAFKTTGNIELKNINEKTGRILFSTDDAGNAKWGDGACISKCSFSTTRSLKASIPSGSVQFLPFTVELFDICNTSNFVNITGDNDFHTFTAPYDGIYQFDFVGTFVSASGFSLGIYTVNASNQPVTQLFASLAPVSTTERTEKFTAIVQLTAGQKVAPTVQGSSATGSIAFNNSDNTAGTRFSGRIIEATNCFAKN